MQSADTTVPQSGSQRVDGPGGRPLGATTKRRAPARRNPIVGLLIGVTALALAGVALTVGILTGGSSKTGVTLPPGPFGLSQDIPASFGVVAVEHVEKLNGLTAQAVAGATHGISGFVAPNKVQVQASVTLTNLLERPVAYSPTQFRLLVGKDLKPVAQVKSSITPGTLQPNASIDAQLQFVAPRSGSKLWIEFRDPGRKKPILVDLGRTGTTPPGAFDGFHTNH